jgi:hypothetical protein
MTSFGPERLTGSAPSVGIAPFSWSPWKAYGFLIVTSNSVLLGTTFHTMHALLLEAQETITP